MATTTAIVLLVIYFTSVHARGLVETVWGILEEVDPRFVQENMRDPLLKWYMTNQEFKLGAAKETEAFLDENYGFAIYIIKIGSNWNEDVVRQSIDSFTAFTEGCLLRKPVGIEIKSKPHVVIQSGTSSSSHGNQLLMIGVSRALIQNDPKSNPWKNVLELRDFFEIQKIDREAQNWASAYSTKGANSGEPRKYLEVLTCIPGFEIMLLPTIRKNEDADGFLSLAEQEANGKPICAVGCDYGRKVSTVGPTTEVVSNNLSYITVVMRTEAPFEGISPLVEMPFSKTMTISREFLYTFSPLLVQEAAMKAVHDGKNLDKQYIAISELFNVDTTIGVAILVLSSKLKLAYRAPGASGDNSDVIPFGIFWDYIPSERMFNMTVTFPAEIGKTG